ncbi:MAG TPA: MFS transporter [Bryobacteraceae bacterium]|nr:MFS transporter [Bryobacteraceae bacterium]
MPISPAAQAVKRSPLLPIFLIVLVDILGLTIILPLLPFYAEHLGASATVVGLLISSFALCQLIAGPILGNLSDHMGRKPLLIVSQIGTLIGFLILAYANQLWLVFLSRIIDGLTAGNLSLAQAYIADVTAPENRAKSFAVIGIAFGIGFLIGPGISGFLSQYGYSYPILAAAFLSACSILCTAILLPKEGPHTQTAEGDSGPGGRRLSVFHWNAYAQYFARPELGNLLWQFFLFAFGFSLSMSGFALFAQRRYTWNGHPVGAREVGYIFAYVGFLGIILQGGLMGRLVKWLGERTLVWTGFATTSATAAWMAWTFTIPQLLVNSTFSSYGSGGLRPALTSLITQNAGKREQGVVLGLTQSLTSISAIIAPVIAGSLIDGGFLNAWAYSIAVVAFAGMIVSVRAAQRHST